MNRLERNLHNSTKPKVANPDNTEFEEILALHHNELCIKPNAFYEFHLHLVYIETTCFAFSQESLISEHHGFAKRLKCKQIYKAIEQSHFEGQRSKIKTGTIFLF